MVLALSVLCASCIEYRFDHLGVRDYYIGYVRTIPALDPKMGSKAKLYMGIGGPTQPYIGGHFARRRLTMNLGVIHYLSPRSSIEVGYRTQIHKFEGSRWGDETGNLNWHNSNLEEDLFYFGGVFRF